MEFKEKCVHARPRLRALSEYAGPILHIKHPPCKPSKVHSGQEFDPYGKSPSSKSIRNRTEVSRYLHYEFACKKFSAKVNVDRVFVPD